VLDRAIRTFGPAAALLLSALAVLAFVLLSQGVAGSHRSGGCTGIPIVNGQPAYPCTNTPPP